MYMSDLGRKKNISIVGTVGVPANYGGFETLVDNLVVYHQENHLLNTLSVYCSSKQYKERKKQYLSAKLKYIPLDANGIQSIPYDIVSLLRSVISRDDVILILGVSGSIFLPVIRMLTSAKIVTNIDGIEWRREKWKGLAKFYLKLSEKIAVSYSHEIIADNGAIAEYVMNEYGVNSHIIAYGGDHAVAVKPLELDEIELPENYATSICRIEPENNIHLILEAFSKQSSVELVLVGNWQKSDYGRQLFDKYSFYEHIHLLNPIYNLSKLSTLRSEASYYIHGHSAGGTNPSLVEAMHFGIPILAYDCDFNRYTTENKADYFDSSDGLVARLDSLDSGHLAANAGYMQSIAMQRYSWETVAKKYFSLLQCKRSTNPI